MNRRLPQKHSIARQRNWHSHPRWRACLICAILVFGWAPRWSSALDRNNFYFASLENTYTAMHPKESRMAMQSIIQKIFAAEYPEIRLHLDFLPKNAGLIDTLTNKPYDVIATTGLDYLQLRGRIHLRPLAILSKTDQPTDVYLIVTHKNKTLKTLKELPVRRLIIEAGGGGDIAKLWLDTVLETHGLPLHQLFFTTLSIGEKPSRTLLPVFFGQADACIISENAFTVMSELNPQIKEQLIIQERSPGYVTMLICATTRLEDWARDMVIKETERMHTYPDGQQILTIMQMKRFFDFKPQYLEATERLRQWQRQHGEKH
jgi:hypothetical protein